MSDEGIGCRIIEQLIEQQESFPNVEFIEVGTKGMTILHLFANRKKAVIIDCALMGTKPGTIKKFTPDDVNSVKKLSHYSLHEADVLEIIEMSSKLGQCPEEIIIFGIEPQTLEQGLTLSTALSSKLPDYITAIRQQLLNG